MSAFKFGPIAKAFVGTAHSRILARLSTHHRGIDNAVALSSLVFGLGLQDDRQHSRMRRTLADALEAGQPIGSARTGYFWILTEAERQENIRVLHSRREHIGARIAALEGVVLE